MTTTILGDRDGETYSRPRDLVRLNGQALDVWQFMADGKYHTPHEIETATGHNWAAAGARLRDFRKIKFSAHTVDRVSLGGGRFAYRLIINEQARVAA